MFLLCGLGIAWEFPAVRCFVDFSTAGSIEFCIVMFSIFENMNFYVCMGKKNSDCLREPKSKNPHSGRGTHYRRQAHASPQYPGNDVRSRA